MTRFDLTDRVAVITGGAGLLGRRHARAIAGAGGIPVLLDIDAEATKSAVDSLKVSPDRAMAVKVDITVESDLLACRDKIVERFGRIDILINNAANNPKVENAKAEQWSRLEGMPVEQWNADLAVGLTGAFLCSRIFGGWMAEKGRGVILNIASDLSVIAPDQRIYRKKGLAEAQQPVKPVTYSVVKSGLVGLTRYIATYWAEAGIRCNALSPGGVYAAQDDEFVGKLTNLIPLGRMAEVDEYEGAVLFLCSDASSYMTGQNLIVDGGRSCW